MQVPKLIRWRFKLEPYQILKVNVTGLNLWGNPQSFYARMSKDGRIVIPALPLAILGSGKPNLTGYIMMVTLEPS